MLLTISLLRLIAILSPYCPIPPHGSIPLDILENGFRFLTRRFPLYLYIWFVTLSAAIANSCKTIKIMDNNAIDLRRSGQEINITDTQPKTQFHYSRIIASVLALNLAPRGTNTPHTVFAHLCTFAS